MTGKIKLTQEQADAIQEWLLQKYGNKAELLNAHAQVVGKQGGWPEGNPYESFNGLDQSDMARALLIGYEVKENYKVGDWVVYEGEVMEIVAVEFAEILNKNNAEREIPHATPKEIKAEKERRVWKSIGRKVGEFKRGDVGVLHNGLSVRKLDNLTNLYEGGSLQGFYPEESFVLFGGEKR